jgi:glycine/D-amino acid oxidase-like deaminating enzyme
VIGAGIAGLTSAYLLLRKANPSRDRRAGIGAGETGRTTAHFFPPDECAMPKSNAASAATRPPWWPTATASATDCVEAIIRSERIDCEFERLDGYLFSPARQWDDTLDKRIRRHHARAWTCAAGTRARPALRHRPCLRFANQAQFHPLKYLDGLARAITRMGGRIHGARAHWTSTATATHKCRDHRNAARSAPARWWSPPTRRSTTGWSCTPSRPATAPTWSACGCRADALPRILLWDTGDPYYYVRLETAGRPGATNCWSSAAQDHKVGQDDHPEHRYDEIERWVRERFPMAGAVEYRWSGEVMEPSDGLAFLGAIRWMTMSTSSPATRATA